MRKVSAIRRVMGIGLVFALALAVCISQSSMGQQSNGRLHSYSIAESLDQKFQQKVQFRPKANTPLDQLIEVAKTFQIPMGMNGLTHQNAKRRPLPFELKKRLESS